MEAFLVSISTVALAEMGDRTQLLSLLLATRLRRPWPILDAAVGISMAGMALWMLKPDALNENEARQGRRGAFLTTPIAFFIAEIGDKTQFATLALAAGYSNLFAVIAGTTCGTLAANAPVVFLGNIFASRLPMRAIHVATTALLLIVGIIFICRAVGHYWHGHLNW
jgi:putative Ca2+/H+ antiporter (TMEM165/GDT1 family)